MAVTMRHVGIPENWWDNFEPPPGTRAEIIRGELVLSPSPARRHVSVQSRLMLLLDPLVPEGYEVLIGLEWRLVAGGIVAQAPQPDLVVVPVGDDEIVAAPLLAVEVLSPSDHRLLERQSLSRIEGKRLDYAANGLAHYLEIDVLSDRPRILRYEGREGALVIVDEVGWGGVLAAAVPFGYAIHTADL